MKKRVYSRTTISIATVLIVLLAATGLLLAKNYQNHLNNPATLPLLSKTIEVSSGLTNAGGIDKVYVIESAAALRQQLKLSTLEGFDPTTQFLVGVVTPGKPNAGYSIALDQTNTLKNRVNINYRVNAPEAGTNTASVITYPKLWLAINRVDLPNYASIDFVFNNLTDGATQTITKELGAQ